MPEIVLDPPGTTPPCKDPLVQFTNRSDNISTYKFHLNVKLERESYEALAHYHSVNFSNGCIHTTL
jgi:hypothetical protein